MLIEMKPITSHWRILSEMSIAELQLLWQTNLSGADLVMDELHARALTIHEARGNR